MPPKPRKKRDDGDYVPSEEEVDDSEEVSEEETEETEETAKKTTKKTKKSKKEDYSSIPTEEETATTESPKKGSGRRKKDDEYEPSDSEGEDEGLSPGGSKAGEKKVRNPTKKIAQMLKKGEEKLDEGKLTPPTPKKSSKKNKDQVQATDNDNESNELDDLLASFPLPSSSRPRIFNKNIAMIGALNIQAFGKSKASNSVLMKIITDILRLYDIILCQEIRASDEIIRQLTESVSTPATPFDYVSSRLIGRTTYQERYVFLYRKNEWKVLEDYVVDDEKLGDKFIREPYVVRFQHLRKTDVRITLVGCHTQPDNAFDEIKTLVSSVYVDVKKKLVRDMVQEKRQLDRGTKVDEKHPTGLRSFLWKYFCCCFGYSPDSARDFTEEASTMGLSEDGTTKEPIIILGDLNASGSYLNKTQRIQIDTILKEFNLIWGIQHQSDTTVSDGSDAAYDRFIFEAANERRWIGKTGIWRFDEGWQKGKDDVDLIKKAARRVTDHYPIEFELKLV